MSQDYTGVYEGIPFVELATGNYLFIVDYEKWDLESVRNWSNNISKCLPDIKFVILLKSMFTDIKNLTDEQFEFIKNIIKK